MNNINKPLFFIHIPKTAGSSFRKAAEAYFGTEKSFYDYAPQSVETHPKVIEFAYEKKDLFSAGDYITKHAHFFSGHVHYVKYAPFFHPNNIITFVRSPEQQVRSHYEHFIRDQRYEGSFETFIADKRYANVQSRILGGLGVQGYGFVGLTEDYETSINLINQLYNTDFKSLDLNKNKAKKQPSYVLTEQELDLIHQHNKDDFALYDQACSRFQRQKKAIEQSQPFIRFALLHLPPQQAQLKIHGWATCYESNEAQQLTIYINNVKTEAIIANEYRNFAKERNMNRNGFIGFTYHFPKDIKDNDKVEIYSSNHELVYLRHYKKE